MTVTETFKKALVCFEDFIPDFCEKLAKDGAIDYAAVSNLESKLYLALTEFLTDY